MVITSTLPVKLVKYVGCAHCAAFTGGITSLMSYLFGYNALNFFVIFLATTEFFMAMTYLQPLTSGAQAVNYCYYRNNIVTLSYDSFNTSLILKDSNNLYSVDSIKLHIDKLKDEINKLKREVGDIGEIGSCEKINPKDYNDFSHEIINTYNYKVSNENVDSNKNIDKESISENKNVNNSNVNDNTSSNNLDDNNDSVINDNKIDINLSNNINNNNDKNKKKKENKKDKRYDDDESTDEEENSFIKYV